MPENTDPSLTRLEALMKERIKTRERRERTARLRVALLAATIALFGTFASLIGLVALAKNAPTQSILEISKQDFDLLRLRVDELRNAVNELKVPLEALNQPNQEAALLIEHAELRSKAEVLEVRLRSLESAILESPERALSIPLLRKDVADLAKRAEEYRELSKSDIDRLYAQQTWMLGGIGTVLFAVAGGAITIVLKSLPRAQRNED